MSTAAAALPPAIILVRPQLGANIGSCARAMLNFGVSDLRLVSPRDGWPNPDAGPSASGADDVLAGARVFDSVAAAVADLHFVYETTLRNRALTRPVLTPPQAAADIRARPDASGILFGTEPRNDPMLADAYTGYWFQQAQASGSMIDWRDAAGIAGAAVLRRPMGGQIGHIVISDGRGGTVEAHSRLQGVIAGTLSDRRWDCAILVPGVRYLRSDVPVPVNAGTDTLRLTSPLTRGDSVRAIQQRLVALGFMAGDVDGIFGPQTAHAVRMLQAHKGLVADGEVGRLTWKALGLD